MRQRGLEHVSIPKNRQPEQQAMLTRVTGADADQDLADVDTSDDAVGLAPGTTHTSLQSIGTSARQHLVDADDVEGVGADAEMEAVLAGGLDEVLVGANTGGLERLRAQLLELVGHHVDAEREVIDAGALAAEIEDADLRVRHTTVEPRLRVRLERRLVSESALTKSPKQNPSREMVLRKSIQIDPITSFSFHSSAENGEVVHYLSPWPL